MTSATFDPTWSHTKVWEHAQKVLIVANALARIADGRFEPVTLSGSAILVHDDGRQDAVVKLQAAAPAVASLGMVVTRVDGRVETPAEDTPQDRFATAIGSNNRQLHEALETFGSREQTWASLYVVFELICDGLGGQHEIEKRAWAPKLELDRFKKNANDRRLTGSWARHGKTEAGPLIHQKMELPEATALIGSLLRHWIDEGP